MKKNVFTFFAVLLAATLCASAQINVAGTYKGLLEVEVLLGGDDIVPFENTNVIITGEDGGTFKLSVLNFVFPIEGIGDIEIGNLDVTGLSASEEEGVITLSKSGASNGPNVPMGDLALYTFIYVNSASIENGNLKLNLSVTAHISQTPELAEPAANVTFEGNYVTGIFSPKAETIAIYPTIVDEVITVAGLESADYAIYAQNGALVKAGKINNGTINVANLGTGIYFLNINGASAKFIKK